MSAFPATRHAWIGRGPCFGLRGDHVRLQIDAIACIHLSLCLHKEFTSVSAHATSYSCGFWFFSTILTSSRGRAFIQTPHGAYYFIWTSLQHRMFDQIHTRTRASLVTCTTGVVFLGAAWVAASQSPLSATQTCRCFPGDECWPSAAEWDAFNQTVGGRLIQTVPVASPCHDSFPGVNFDNATCADIRADWIHPEFHDKTSHSPMAAFFANESCDPFTDRAAQCVVGSYVQYAVNASGASDYVETLAFAKERNIRLVIRNTGHDYLGKSTGAGSLALWTHHLKDIDVLEYSSDAYTGKAMKMGAGVEASEAQSVAHALGLLVVEGGCPTVGIAGGYTQGGGVGPLGSKFGLAADQVLEWEVVTPTGQIITATPDQNLDLYWALSGGGGGTYGAVLSMTVKLHPDMPTGGATLFFTEPTEKYRDVLQAFLINLPAIVDAGAVVYWQIIRKGRLTIPQSYLPNGTAQDLERLFQPTLLALNQSRVAYGIEALFTLRFKTSPPRT